MPHTSTAWEQLSERVLTVEQIRQVDRDAVERYRMNSLVLMENAALGCVRWLVQRCARQSRAVILCGSGNNGGDGLAIARHLRVLGWVCRAVVLGPLEKLSRDARANFDILAAAGGQDLYQWSAGDPPSVDLDQSIDTADVVVDAMLGTGAVGPPRSPLREWIHRANRSPAMRVAIDIPTGWNATTGEHGECVFQAQATLTFVAKKPAMSDPAAAAILGEICVLPIGIPEEQIRELLKLTSSALQ